MHPGQHRLAEHEFDDPRTAVFAQRFDIGVRPVQFSKIRIHVEVRARPADQIGPQFRAKLMTICGEHFLPGLELRTLRVQNQAVEIEDESFDHVTSYRQT